MKCLHEVTGYRPTEIRNISKVFNLLEKYKITEITGRSITKNRRLLNN
jgi:hypothetical protein